MSLKQNTNGGAWAAEARNMLYSKAWRRVLVSILASSSLIYLTTMIVEPAFATIDDARLLYVYSGYASGTPTGTYLFLNALWGNLIAGLYNMIPNVNWYYLYQIMCVWIACSIFGMTLLEFGRRANAPISVLAVVFLLLFVVLFQNAVILMHFEVCAGMLGASGITLLLLVDLTKRNTARKALLVSSCGLMLLCCAQEKNTFYASMAFYAVAAAYQIVKAFTKKDLSKADIPARAFLVAVLCVAVGAAAAHLFNGQAMRASSWQEYLEYNPYRVAFWDYERPTFAENSEEYERAGWSEEFYEATQYMYFMDERFNTDALASIVEPFSRTKSSVSESPLTSIPRTLYTLFKAEVLARWQFLLIVILGLQSIICFISRSSLRDACLEIILYFCGALLAAALCIYLAWRGRLPLRAWEAISLPAIMLCINATMRLRISTSEDRVAANRPFRCLRVGIYVVIAGLICYAASDIQPYCERTDDALTSRHEYNSDVSDVEKYALIHPENIYVTGYMYQNYNPFTNYPEEKPTNVVSWGSSYYKTPVYFDQMKENGRGVLDSTSLVKERNVFLIANKTNYADITAVYNMLKKDYGATSVVWVDSINTDIVVLKII